MVAHVSRIKLFVKRIHYNLMWCIPVRTVPLLLDTNRQFFSHFQKTKLDTQKNIFSYLNGFYFFDKYSNHEFVIYLFFFFFFWQQLPLVYEHWPPSLAILVVCWSRQAIFYFFSTAPIFSSIFLFFSSDQLREKKKRNPLLC